MVTPELLEFCKTEKQRNTLRTILHNNGNITRTSKELGISRATVQEHVKVVKKYASVKGYSPEHDMNHTAPDPFIVKGTSTYYNDEGKPTGQWVKTTLEDQRRQQLVEETLKAMAEEIPREKPIKAPKPGRNDITNLYVITDYHIGMKAWHQETGDDWDTDIAEDLLVEWFTAAIKSSPKASTAVFAQLGDFLHWDGLEAVTPTSGHVVDADTRFRKIVRVAIRVVRRIIRMMLRKYESIHVIMAEGNHDLAGSIWMSEWMAALYEEEPRVTVDQNADVYYCHEFGKVSLFFHHGHKKKQENLDTVFVAKYREVFGRTKHSYGHMGHHHHVSEIETNLMIIEKHRTLAAPDSHASRHGFVSGRDAKAITYHKDHGRVGEIILSPELVRNMK